MLAVTVVALVDSTASKSSIITWSNIAMLFSSKAPSCEFRITSIVATSVATPEWTTTNTGCVVVGWGRSVTLLLLVMTDKENLEDGSEEEEDTTNGISIGVKIKEEIRSHVDDGDRKDSFLQSASPTIIEVVVCSIVTGARTQRCVDCCAGAFFGPMSGEDCNGNVTGEEADVEDDGQKGEEADPSQAKGQEDTEEAI